VNKGIALETTGNGFMEINHGTHYVDVCLANVFVFSALTLFGHEEGHLACKK